MGTYDYKKVLTDWSNGTLTADMALGHSLQHIAALHEQQAAINTTNRKLQAQLDHLENKVKTLQTEIDRLVKGFSRELAAAPSNPPTLT